MLMRYLYFIFLQNQKNVLPIFIELRELNDAPSEDIFTIVLRRIAEHVESFDEVYLRTALQSGAVALFLDGYDEIDHDRRSVRGREIIRLAEQYPNALMVVSSRPDEAFKGWTTFFLYYLQRLTEQQVRLLINKIPYDLTIKALFIRKLDGGLYATHREFLTNPLLTVMMLITLEQFADVPAKIHLFYEYAFEALFARHDVTKGGFQRKCHIGIALDDYRRLFSYFCAITYMHQSFSFSETNALEYLSQAIKSSQIAADQSGMLRDLTECTCMLAREGLDFVFSHRSFQEYFVAYFLSRIKVEEFPAVAPKLVARADMDNVS